MSTNSPDAVANELITKAAAARARGITRQAIHNLVIRGKLRTAEVGGREFVYRSEVMTCADSEAASSAPIDRAVIDQIRNIIEQTPGHLRPAIREELFPYTRHALENKLGVSAELIMTAVDKAGDITLRGLRGIITEEVFRRHVLEPLVQENPRLWSLPDDYDANQNLPYDAVLVRGDLRATIQVKMQRSEKFKALTTDPHGKNGILPGYWIVETQKTRNAKDSSNSAEDVAEGGETDESEPKKKINTRPYKFGEFDILAVSIHPATGEWGKFYFTLGDWLLPRDDNSQLLRVYQPVAKEPVDGEWTDDLEEVFDWFVANEGRRDKKLTGLKPPRIAKTKKKSKRTH